MIEIITDIVGKNKKGEICHPYKYRNGARTGLFVYTLSGNDDFVGVSELGLRELIERGTFNFGGRIRMIPKTAKTTASASALNVISYKGRSLP